jgi:hypothetical protein
MRKSIINDLITAVSSLYVLNQICQHPVFIKVNKNGFFLGKNQLPINNNQSANWICQEYGDDTYIILKKKFSPSEILYFIRLLLSKNKQELKLLNKDNISIQKKTSSFTFEIDRRFFTENSSSAAISKIILLVEPFKNLFSLPCFDLIWDYLFSDEEKNLKDDYTKYLQDEIFQKKALAKNDLVISILGKEILNIRCNYQEKYRAAAENKITSITFAPAYSYKTETVLLTSFFYSDIFIFDMRDSSPQRTEETWAESTYKIIAEESEKMGSGKNVFLDAVDIILLPLLAKLIVILEKNGFSPHLLSHLNSYERTIQLKGAFKNNAEIYFPQALSIKDIESLKSLFSPSNILDSFFELFQGWPAMIYFLNNSGKRQKLMGILKNNGDIKGLICGFKRPALNELKQNVTEHIKIFIREQKNKIFLTPEEKEQLINNKVRFPNLLINKDVKLWEAVKHGLMWYDEEKMCLFVPTIIQKI